MDHLTAAPGAASPTAPTPSANSAIQRCLDAWSQIMNATPKPDYFTQKDAGAAFRAAMPELTSLPNVQNFIACVSRGILLGAIDEKHAPKLLSAAQMALRSFSSEPAPKTSKKEKNALENL